MVKGKNRLVLVILCISNFLCMLDTTIMTIVIPKIQSGLNASLDQVSWAVNLYAIIFASVTLLAARIAEIYGKNRYLLYGLILFLIGSIGSGCAPSLGFLYGSRIIQSLGATFILPLGTIIGMEIVAQQDRNKIVSLVGGCQGFAAAVGPVTGGLISKYFGWRGVFFINVPFLIGLILLIPFCMNLKHEKKLKNVKIDFLGAILSIGMMLGLTLGLVQGRQWHWGSPAIISLFGLSAICGVGFIVTEMKSAKPMIDLSLFKSRNFDGASLALAISSFFLGGFVILIPTFLVKFKGLTELQAAIRILPYSITVFLAVIIASLLVKKINNRLMILIGFILIFVSYCFLSKLQVNLYHRLMIGSILLGCGYGIIAGPTTVISAADFKGQRLTSSQSVMNVLRQVGLVMAIAICMTLLNGNVSSAKQTIQNYGNQQIADSGLTQQVKNKLKRKLDQKIENAQNSTDSKVTVKFNPIKVPQSQVERVTNQTVQAIFQKKGLAENKIPDKIKQAVYHETYMKVASKFNQQVQQINSTIRRIISNVKEKAKSELKRAFIKVYAQLAPVALLSCLIVLILRKGKREER